MNQNPESGGCGGQRAKGQPQGVSLGAGTENEGMGEGWVSEPHSLTVEEYEAFLDQERATWRGEVDAER